MLVTSHLPRQRRIVAWLMGTVSLLVATTTSQQSPLPSSAYSMAYTTINEDTFYIQGGSLVTGPDTYTNTSQFYSLDLTQPTWSTLNPPWKALSAYPFDLSAEAPSYGHSISVASDSSSFTLWISSPNVVVTYNIASGTWKQVLPSPPLTLFRGSDMQAATDPTTGLVYIPGGEATYNMMSVYSFSTGMSPSVTIPSTLMKAGGYYTFVWSQVRKTFIYFGGNAEASNPFFEFSPSLNKWTTLPTVGSNIPPFKIRSCMVPAYNGTKMLLFGGNTNLTPSVDTLYILDLVSMTWTQAPSSLEPRSAMACSVSGDNFIVWGGYRKTPATTYDAASPPLLIYNIYLGKWTTTFTRGSHPNEAATGNPNPGKPVDGGNGGSSGGNSGDGKGAAIGGGIAAGMVIIAAIAFFFIRKRRQTRKQDQQPTVTSKEAEAAYQEQGPRDPILASVENPVNGPAHYTYSSAYPENNTTYNHNYSQNNPGDAFNKNNNNNNNNHNNANNYNYDQAPPVFAMTERENQPGAPQAGAGFVTTWQHGAPQAGAESVTTWQAGVPQAGAGSVTTGQHGAPQAGAEPVPTEQSATAYSPTTPTYVPTSPTHAPSYATAYSPPPPIPARPKHISSTITVPIDPNNQDHMREVEYQVEMGKQQLAYALQHLKSAPAVTAVNNPQYNPIQPEPEPPLIEFPRGPQGAGVQMAPARTTPAAPQLDQSELVRKIESMQAELQDLHAQLGAGSIG